MKGVKKIFISISIDQSFKAKTEDQFHQDFTASNLIWREQKSSSIKAKELKEKKSLNYFLPLSGVLMCGH